MITADGMMRNTIVTVDPVIKLGAEWDEAVWQNVARYEQSKVYNSFDLVALATAETIADVIWKTVYGSMNGLRTI